MTLLGSVFEQFVQSDLSHLPAGRASRTDIVRNTIAGLDKDIASDKSILQGDLCRAKLLDMLHPFSNSTRNRLTALVSPLAKRIKHMRLDICRRSVAREVLARDLLSEERDLTRLMASASRPRLQSATSELSVSRHELHATQISRRHTDSPFPSSAEASSDVTSSVAPSEPTQQLGMKI